MSVGDSGVKLQVTIFADGRTAVRAFNQTAQASKKAGEQVQKDAKKQKESFASVEEGSRKLRGAIGSLAGTIGLAGLGFGIADVIKAGQDWQLQQSRLQQSLKATGLLSRRTMEQLNRSAETTATQGGFAAPEQISSLAQLVRLTGSVTKAVRDNKAAMELARGSGLDYTRAQRMIGQALTGNVGRLQRYLGIIQPVKTAEFALSQSHQFNVFQMEAQSKALGKLGPLWLKQQEILHNLTPAMVQHAQLLDRQATAQNVLARIQQRYGGSMQAFSRTTAGAISNAKNAIDLAMEKLGSKALPVVARIAQGIASFVTYLSDHKNVLIAFGTALGGIGAAFGFTKLVEGVRALAGAIVAFAGAEEGATVATIAWGTAMRMTIVGIIITALYLLITHFGLVKRIAIDVARWTVGAWHTVARFFSGLGHTISHPFVVAFDAVKRAVEDVVKWIVSKFEWVAHTVGHVIHGITSLPGHVLGSVGHFLGSVFHTGGPVRHMAWGGPIGGFGGGDVVPSMLEPGEFVLRKEAVQNIGVQNLNSINALGSQAGSGAPDRVYVAAPIKFQVGNRVLTEAVAHFAAKRGALSGSYVSG